MAGLTDIKLLSSLRAPQFVRRRNPFDTGGDIFFCDKDVFYIVETHNELSLDYMGRPMYRAEDESQPTLEIGIISPDPDKVESRLREFTESVEQAIKAKLDGRKTRHMSFEWSKNKPGTPRLDQLKEKEKKTQKNILHR